MILAYYADALTSVDLISEETQKNVRENIEAMTKRSWHEEFKKREKIIEQKYFDDPYQQHRAKRDVIATDKLRELLKNSATG
jgi:hypothetical protein